MMKIPSGFNKISKVEDYDEQSLLLSLICTCGEKDFSILVNTNDPYFSKKEEIYNSIIKKYGGYGRCRMYFDENCDLFINYGGIRGLFTKPKLYDRDIVPVEAKIAKAKCLHCGKEFLLYDNRKIGLVKYKKELDYTDFIYKETIIPNETKIKFKYDITEECYKSDRKYSFPNRKPYKDFYNHIEIFYIEDK